MHPPQKSLLVDGDDFDRGTRAVAFRSSSYRDGVGVRCAHRSQNSSQISMNSSSAGHGSAQPHQFRPLNPLETFFSMEFLDSELPHPAVLCTTSPIPSSSAMRLIGDIPSAGPVCDRLDGGSAQWVGSVQ